ncbi:MAG: type II secretion system protein [Sideroxydans sp.]|nr:type II secretion system protein [Sideroxydans sp.]
MNIAEQNLQLLQEIEAGRDFLLAAYEQNPELLKRTEPRIQQLFGLLGTEKGEMPASQLSVKQRGISLIELIMFIVIVSIGVTGILLVMNQTTAHSADPLLHKQALAVAESLLEEVELQDFIDQNDGVTTACPVASAVTAANRATDYHIVDCYNGFNMPGISDLAGAAIVGLENYSSTVTLTSEALNDVAAGNAVRITVTVTDPQGTAITIDGYRTAY